MGLLLRRQFGKPEQRAKMTPYMQHYLAQVDSLTPEQMLDANLYLCQMWDALAKVFKHYDLLLCPTVATTDIRPDFDYSRHQISVDGKPVDANKGWFMTYPFNSLSQCPVLAMPNGFCDNGVPSSLQIVGQPYQEGDVFAVAQLLADTVASDFYTNTFGQIKQEYPHLKLHALGPPEVAHICKLEKMSHKDVLTALKEAGLDSLPGAGAEILIDRVRRLISKGKCGAQEWLDIMHEAHKLNITTSGTMMFGHVETLQERFEHLVKIREVQSRKPEEAKGFLAFIPWTFQDVDTLLAKIRGVHNLTTAEEYVRMIAMSRIMLPNVKNIQASWLTVGKQTAQLCLQAGANDFGSIMIEENVVSAAGAPHRFTYKSIQEAIREAGFEPQLRTQQYEWRELPNVIEEQVVNY